MKSLNQILLRVALCGAVLLVPSRAVFSQCNLKIDPPPKIILPKPGFRICCAFGFDTGIDPKMLTGHKYEGQPQQPGGSLGILPNAPENSGEKVGYIYTAAAGFVDIGHVRDNADMFLWVYTALQNGQHTIEVGRDKAGVVNIPASKDQMLALAGAITFVSSWSHELTTWGYTEIGNITQRNDFSAFSPEDMSSNIVGIKAATDAINAGGAGSTKAFDQQMDVVLPKLIADLGPQAVDGTDQLLTYIKFVSGGASEDLTSKWWMFDLRDPRNAAIRLLRRNFDGAPWKIAGTTLAPTPLPNPSWLNTTQFSNLYSQFLYLVDDTNDVDATQMPRTNAYALVTLASLAWAPTPAQPLISDASEISNPAYSGVLCLVDPKTQKVIPSGQYVGVKVNVNPPPPQDVLWSFEHATQFLQKNFTAVNPNMDGPLTYTAPDIPRPAAAK